jgi:hypothetical protein
MAHLQAYPNTLMEADPLRCRDALIEYLLIQGVDEVIATCHRTVWPGLFPARPQELSSPYQGGTPVVYVLGLLCQTRRHSGCRKLHPGDTRRL